MISKIAHTRLLALLAVLLVGFQAVSGSAGNRLTIAQQRCEMPGVQEWRAVLMFGHRLGYEDYTVDGKSRHTMVLTHRRNLYVFVFMYPDQPGALEPGAWHGCAIYLLGDFPG